MLFRVSYTLDQESSSVRWTPLLGDEFRDHQPRTTRSGYLTVEAPGVDELIRRMGWFDDVIAFALDPLSGDASQAGRPVELLSAVARPIAV